MDFKCLCCKYIMAESKLFQGFVKVFLQVFLFEPFLVWKQGSTNDPKRSPGETNQGTLKYSKVYFGFSQGQKSYRFY